MSIPVHLGVAVVFDDRIDLFARSADGVPMTLRLTGAAAASLAVTLTHVLHGLPVLETSVPAVLDHPEPLPDPPSSLAEPRAPP